MNKEILQKYIKDPKKLIMPGFVVFILVVGGLLSSSASAKKQKMKQEYDLVEQQIDGQRRKMLDVPSLDKIDRLKQKYKLMEDIYKKTLLNWKSRQKEYSPLRPLQFKEELLTNQQKLETMAGGYEFPRGFGFIESIFDWGFQIIFSDNDGHSGWVYGEEVTRNFVELNELADEIDSDGLDKAIGDIV